MSRFCVTGGSGFLGINLVRWLLARGHQVTSLDVAPFEHADCRDRIEIVTGDVRDAAAVARAVQGAPIVVHGAAALPRYKKDDIFTTDVDGTRNVLTAAFNAGAERVVHISSTAVYGVPDHHPIFEDDTLEGVGWYGQAKIAAEAVCLEFRRAGRCVPILRPKSFIGPERLGVFAILYDWACTGHHFPMIGRGDNRYQLLDVEDLCDAIGLAAGLDPSVANDTFNIGADVFATMKEDFQAVLDCAGHGKKIRCFPAGPAVAVLKVLEFLRLSPLYKWVYETAGQESFVSIDKAERVLGYAPKYSNQDALIRNYRWYVEHLGELASRGGLSHRVPWGQGVFRIAKWFF